MKSPFQCCHSRGICSWAGCNRCLEGVPPEVPRDLPGFPPSPHSSPPSPWPPSPSSPAPLQGQAGGGGGGRGGGGAWSAGPPHPSPCSSHAALTWLILLAALCAYCRQALRPRTRKIRACCATHHPPPSSPLPPLHPYPTKVWGVRVTGATSLSLFATCSNKTSQPCFRYATSLTCVTALPTARICLSAI